MLLLEVMSRVIQPKREAGAREEPLAQQAKDEKIVVMLVAGLVVACMVVGCVSQVDPFGNRVQATPPLITPTPSPTTQASETPTITPTPQVAVACTPSPTPTTITRATPTPSPIPSPTPGVERHMARTLVPIHTGSTTPGILVWDPGGSRGLYPYYTHGDHAVLELRFVNTIPEEVVDPVVEVAVEREGALVACWRQVVDATIPGATRENPSPSYTTRLEYDITEAIPPGDYTIKVTVIVDNTEACQIRQTITIYPANE